MKSIRKFTIKRSELSALKENRVFTVRGDDDAVFSLQVKTSAGRFYNFTSKAFETSVTSQHRLANRTLRNGMYNGQISFPADADGETYTILLYAEPHYDTKIDEGLVGDLSGEILGYNPFLYQIDITQVADVVVTFTPIASTSADYTETSISQTTTITQSPTVSAPAKATINWTVSNAGTDLKGFGLCSQLTLRDRVADIPDSKWYTATTAVVNDTQSDDGGGSTHYNYKVDDISDLSVGMSVVGQNTTLTRVYIDQDIGKDTIKMANAKAFSNNTTLTLNGYGVGSINKAAGMELVFSNIELTQNPQTTTVRGTANTNRTQIDVNGTYGIGKNPVDSVNTFIEGFGVNNTSSNPIVGVSPSSSAGSITASRNQTLIEGTVLNIINCSTSYTIKGDVTINKMPSSNKTIYIDLDTILTLGTAS